MLPGNQSLREPTDHDEDGSSRVRMHDDQHAQYSHEMPYDLKESLGRVVIRLVPLLYGFMFGSLADNMAMALSVGVIVSSALDLGMGDKSLFMGVIRPLLKGGCPVIATLARGLAWGIGSVGLPAPKVLGNMRCGVS